MARNMAIVPLWLLEAGTHPYGSDPKSRLTQREVEGIGSSMARFRVDLIKRAEEGHVTIQGSERFEGRAELEPIALRGHF